jgi:prepilin-type N-terminal cleavage/methylation domain-containing protein
MRKLKIRKLKIRKLKMRTLKPVLHQKGMTLLEVTVALLVTGVIIAGLISIYNIASLSAKERITRERMEIITKALGAYVEAANRLPCPADPTVTDASYGFEWGVTTAMMSGSTRPNGAVACNIDINPTRRDGIVPFQTLNIPFEVIRDGWGNLFTYGVSPAFARQTDFSAGAEPAHLVQARCREAGWMDGTNPANAPKARFCCAYQGAGNSENTNDILIQFRAADGTVTNITENTAFFPPRFPQSSYTGTLNEIHRFTSVQEVYPLTSVPTPTNGFESVAFVLVSHGANREGAYNMAGTRTAAIGAEIENTNNDRVYRTGIQDRGLIGDSFDDIVVWKTQDGIMSYNGSTSCRFP